jgi:phosphoketolase
MRSYRPEELFDSAGTLTPELTRLAPGGDRRMSANPHANGGLLLRELVLPDFREYAAEAAAPGASMSEPTRVLGAWLRDVIRANPVNFRLFGPEFDALFTVDRPVIFAYHGYPWLIHRLTYRRNGHANFHVRGYKEEGTTTTPFDMVMLNDLDRFHLVMDVIDRVPGLASTAGHVRQLMVDKRITCRAYTRQEGQDAPEITEWHWPY